MILQEKQRSVAALKSVINMLKALVQPFQSFGETSMNIFLNMFFITKRNLK